MLPTPAQQLIKIIAMWSAAEQENRKLKAAASAAFYAMCNQRDTPDNEVFQDAIDTLGLNLGGLNAPPPRS